MTLNKSQYEASKESSVAIRGNNRQGMPAHMRPTVHTWTVFPWKAPKSAKVGCGCVLSSGWGGVDWTVDWKEEKSPKPGDPYVSVHRRYTCK